MCVLMVIFVLQMVFALVVKVKELHAKNAFAHIPQFYVQNALMVIIKAEVQIVMVKYIAIHALATAV